MENPFEAIIHRLDRIERILSAVTRPATSPAPTPYKEVMNMEQAAKFLDLSKSTLYKLTANRNIPHYKVCKRVYFKKIDLEKWINEKRVTTNEEISSMADKYMSRSRYRRSV